MQIGGCIGTDSDFDGVPYQPRNWPGAGGATPVPDPIRFTSPLFNGSQNYSRVAFETDLPRIEFATNPPCNRSTGAGCVNPPAGANFYPLYTTANTLLGCTWQFGGASLPFTTNTFGGTSTTEFGPLLQLTYPQPGGTFQRFNDFRNVLGSNPCPQ